MGEVINYGMAETANVTMAQPSSGVTGEMMVSRQAQEVQMAIYLAKKFPRNYVESFNRVIEACKRPSLAEKAVYEYPRGGEKVSGPSIRLAEELARNWGNIDFGITELSQENGESQVMAYAWDLETNTRQTKIFQVKHVRYSKKGGMQRLEDPRDIYELVANNGARRLRACILGVIPRDVTEAAVEQCGKTLAGASSKPLVDLIRDMVNVFQTEFGVTLPMLEKYIGWKYTSFSRNDIIRLKRVYTSLKDGMAKKEEIFDMKASADDDQPKDAFAAQANAKQETGKKTTAGSPAPTAEEAQNAQASAQEPQEAPQNVQNRSQDAPKAQNGGNGQPRGRNAGNGARKPKNQQPEQATLDEYAAYEDMMDAGELPFR